MPREFERLSEKEIQRRLYGRYLDPKKKEELGPKEPSKPPKQTSKQLKETSQKEEKKIPLNFVFGFTGILVIIFLMIHSGKRHPSQATGNIQISVQKPPAQRVPVVKPKTTVPPIPERVSSRPYTIQVMVFKNEEGGQKAIDQLKKQEFPAYLKESTTISGKSQFRIYVGDFEKEEDAAPTLAMLKTHLSYRESFVRKK